MNELIRKLQDLIDTTIYRVENSGTKIFRDKIKQIRFNELWDIHNNTSRQPYIIDFIGYATPSIYFDIKQNRFVGCAPKSDPHAPKSATYFFDKEDAKCQVRKNLMKTMAELDKE